MWARFGDSHVSIVVIVFCLALPWTFSWSLAEYPNPIVDVDRCGRRGVRSWVCDPDGLVRYETTNVVEGLLKKIYSGEEPYKIDLDCSSGVQVAVALVRKMDPPVTQSSAQEFAEGLHDAWGVGDRTCQNGVVLFIALENRQMYISTGAGVQKVLPNSAVSSLLGEMRTWMRRGDLDWALENSIHAIGLALANHSEETSPQVYPQVFVFAIIVFLAFSLARSQSKGRRYRECQSRLRQLQQEKARVGSKTYAQTSCPLCLEEWTPASSTTFLECGHKYCDGCIRSWAERANTCPVCRQAIVPGVDGSYPTAALSFEAYVPEMRFRLHRLQRLYPDLVTTSLIDRWSDPRFLGDMTSDPSFTSLAPQTRSAALAAGRGGSVTSFGGGSSSGGGGGGSSW